MERVERLERTERLEKFRSLEKADRDSDKTAAILLHDREREEAAREREATYNPLTGAGSPLPRVLVSLPSRLRVEVESDVWLPVSMADDARWQPESLDRRSYEQLRFEHDFEYWAFRCVTIRDKRSGRRVPFRLNAPQRRLLAMFEADRREGRPIRVVMLKARQWGGSTLVQMYFAYLQIIVRRNWNSVIVGHQKNTSATIKRMYARMLADYPAGLQPEPARPFRLRGVSGAPSMQELEGRGCTIDLGTSQSPDSLRGTDFALAHLSEVAFWADTPRRSADDLIRTVSGSVPTDADTAIVMESTANGVGGFFHDTWLAAEAGKSAYRPMFVPWYEADLYSKPLDDAGRRGVATTLTPYEEWLVESCGATLGQVAWYRAKRGEYKTDLQMHAEFPSTAAEAFVSTGAGVFAVADIDRLRPACREGRRGTLRGNTLTGPDALKGLRFDHDPCGPLTVWSEPAAGSPAGRYVAVVDIGGRAESSDWSVIAVFDRNGAEGKPEVVAQWRGHADHDIVCWQAAAMASWYGRALLVIESNSLESGGVAAADDASLYILGELERHYANMYVRHTPERVAGGVESRPGFHTNRQTKVAVVSALVKAVREEGYTERCAGALDELATYEVDCRGAYNARRGCHDDMLMTRAIGLYVIHTVSPPVRVTITPRYLW